jgi:hypothetical protein
MKKKKELKDEFELDIEFEVDKNNRVDMNQVIELVIAYNKLFRTYKQLKTQIGDISEELELVRCDLHNRTSERDSYESELNECLSQQKEFIKYLEEEKDRLASVCSSIREDKFDEADDILQKYKEIIGGEEIER